LILGKITQIIRAFSAGNPLFIINFYYSLCLDWKRSIESINTEILRSFTNLKNGTNILQTAFGQFVNYYQRFVKIVSHEAFAENQQVKSEVVDSQQIIAELKKYKPVY
jgi:hypothetical protein